MSEQKPKGLHAKLAEVMGEVGRVPKRGRNEFHKYDYATEADIVDAVRGSLSVRGVTLVPRIDSVQREGSMTTVLMTFQFTDGETGEAMLSTWAGTGDDKGDKGLYKAMTGALKYFLLKTFLMPTGDDPEADESTDARAASVPIPPRRGRPTKAESEARRQAQLDEMYGRGPETTGAKDGAPAPDVNELLASSWEDAPAPPSKPQPKDYWRKRVHAYMGEIGFRMGMDSEAVMERRRVYTRALDRAVVTDEQSRAITEDEWRKIGKYLKDTNTPPAA